MSEQIAYFFLCSFSKNKKSQDDTRNHDLRTSKQPLLSFSVVSCQKLDSFKETDRCPINRSMIRESEVLQRQTEQSQKGETEKEGFQISGPEQLFLITFVMDTV